MSTFMMFKRFLKLSRFQASSFIMVSKNSSKISLLIYILDAVSTVVFRPLEPHLLTVSGARHFMNPEESDTDDGSVGVPDDENSPPAKTQLQVIIRDSSIKLWDMSPSSVH
jgi:hypothetical protein